MPARSLNTYIFMIAKDENGIEEVKQTNQQPDNGNWSQGNYFDLRGQRYDGTRPLRPGIYVKNGKKIVVK